MSSIIVGEARLEFFLDHFTSETGVARKMQRTCP